MRSIEAGKISNYTVLPKLTICKQLIKMKKPISLIFKLEYMKCVPEYYYIKRILINSDVGM